MSRVVHRGLTSMVTMVTHVTTYTTAAPDLLESEFSLCSREAVLPNLSFKYVVVLLVSSRLFQRLVAATSL